MHKFKLFVYLLFVALLFSQCEDDKETDPGVRTLEVTPTSASTVTAKGSIDETGSFPVKDYGFEYYTDYNVTQKISLGTLPAKGNFQSEISAMSSNSNYINVRAYLINEKGTVYGQTVQATFPVLSITSVLPLSGKAGDRITITGNNFSSKVQDYKVTFNDIAATVTEASTNRIVVEVPANISTSYYYSGIRIAVKVGNQNITATEGFRVVPTLTDFSPKSGTVGTLVTLTGINFSNSSYSIMLNNQSVSIANSSNTIITFYIPTGITQEKLKINFISSGVTTTVGEFSILAPEITSYSPKTGIGGSLIIITGKNFTGSGNYGGYESVKVKLGTRECAVQSYLPNEIKFTVPKELSMGTYTLSVITPVYTVSSSDQFTLSSPKITSLSPASAIRGTYVTINGENFGSNSSYESSVLVGTTSVNIFSWAENTIKVYIPTSMPLGNFKVTINSGGQSVTSTDNLTITN